MRVVIDPGVYIAAMLSTIGAPAQLLRLWRLRQFDVVVSPELLDELDRTLRRDRFRRHITIADVDAFLVELHHSAHHAADPHPPAAITRDPGDDYLVALAVETADVLVSGDRDLTDLADPPVRILSPRAFLDELAPPTDP